MDSLQYTPFDNDYLNLHSKMSLNVVFLWFSFLLILLITFYVRIVSFYIFFPSFEDTLSDFTQFYYTVLLRNQH